VGQVALRLPARRYASAEELANDLRLFQAGEPIRARPVGAVEHTWKWAKRRPALAALRDTAASLGRLFAGPPRSRWEGLPQSLEETVTRARDLLDDARYLPGPEYADPMYQRVLACLQKIDANLEYVRFLLSLEPEHALRERFFAGSRGLCRTGTGKPGAGRPAVPAV
jgi:hypothetical protein